MSRRLTTHKTKRLRWYKGEDNSNKERELASWPHSQLYITHLAHVIRLICENRVTILASIDPKKEMVSDLICYA